MAFLLTFSTVPRKSEPLNSLYHEVRNDLYGPNAGAEAKVIGKPELEYSAVYAEADVLEHQYVTIKK